MPDRTVSIIAELVNKISPELADVRKRFGRLQKEVNNLRGLFGGLTGAVTTFLGAFAGVQGIRRAISLAEAQVKATTELKFALRGLPEIYEEINRAADEFQRTTTVGNEDFQRTAAFLRQSGVAAEDLASATRAVFDSAAALQKPAQAIARQFISIQATGIARGELKTALQDLTPEAIRAGEAFRVLGERFAGSAAAIAETDFGQAQQEFNELNDLFEEIGSNLIQLKTAFLAAAKEGVQDLVEALDTDEWRVFQSIVKDVLGFIGRNLKTILQVVAAFVALKVAIFTVTAAIALLKTAYATLLTVVAVANAILLSPWTVLLLGITAATVGLEALLDVFVDLGETFADIAGDSDAIFAGIASGALSLGDAIDIIANRFRVAWVKIKRDFFDPLVFSIEGFVVDITAGFQLLGAETRVVFATVSNFVGRAFLTVVQKIDNAIDGLTAGAADALVAVGAISEKTAETIRTNFADSAEEGFNALDEELRDAEQNLARTRERAVADADAITKAAAALAQDRADEIARLTTQTETLIAKAQEATQKARATESQRDEEERTKRLERETQLATAIAAVRLDQNEEGIVRQSELEDRALQERLAKAEIGEAEFAELRLRKAEEVAEAEENALRDRISLLQEEVERRREGGQTAVDLLDKQLALETKLQAARFEGEDSVKAVREEVAALAETITTRATTAQEGFNRTLEELKTLYQEGKITQAEFAEASTNAFTTTQQEIETTKEQLRALGKVFGEDVPANVVAGAEQINETLTELTDEFIDTQDEVAETSTSIWERFSLAFRQRIAQPLTSLIDDLVIGQEAWGEGIDDLNDRFRQFGRDALKIMLRLISQWLVARALGLPTFGANQGGLVHDSGLTFAGGGSVPGPRVNRDIVPARLTPGEFVIRRPAVEHYGADTMRALNRMTMPRDALPAVPRASARLGRGTFQAGGDVQPVAATAPVSDSGPREALVVPSELAFARMVAGGTPALMRWLEAHRTEVSGILGSRP